MNRFRLTIAGLLALTSLIAAACAALSQAEHPWTLSVVQFAMVLVICAATVFLFDGNEMRRIFCVAFLVTIALQGVFYCCWFLSGPRSDPPLGILLGAAWSYYNEKTYDGSLLADHWNNPGGKFVLSGLWVFTIVLAALVGWLASLRAGNPKQP